MACRKFPNNMHKQPLGRFNTCAEYKELKISI